jgi:hypothetical protein
MANEIKTSLLVGGVTYYAVIRNAAGQYYNTVTPGFENYNASNFANYAVSAGTANSAGDWAGTFPVIAAGSYGVTIRQRAGASASFNDTAVAGPNTMAWDGTAEITFTSINARTPDNKPVVDVAGVAQANAVLVNGTAINPQPIGPNLWSLASGTAQAGSSNTITLASSDPAPSGAYVGGSIILTGNTGAGQAALISGHVGKVLTVFTTYPGGNWLVSPNNTTTYSITGLIPAVTSSVTLANEQVGLIPG